MLDCVLQFQHLSLYITKVGSLLDLCLLQNNNSVCREKVALIIAIIREGQRSEGGLLLLLLGSVETMQHLGHYLSGDPD